MAESVTDKPSDFMAKEKFEALDLSQKTEIVQNAILNSIYESLRSGKVRLQDLAKAQTILNKPPNHGTKNLKNQDKFSSTPSPNEPTEPT